VSKYVLSAISISSKDERNKAVHHEPKQNKLETNNNYPRIKYLQLSGSITL